MTNVETILGTADDPRLPRDLDAVLMWTPIRSSAIPSSCCGTSRQALAPNGRLGIVDFKKDGAGGPGPPLEERVDPDVSSSDAAEAGLTLLSEETFLRYQYLLIFGNGS